MKKRTLNAIMQGVMIVLVIAIITVSIKLILRPDVEETQADEMNPSEDVIVTEEIPEVVSEEEPVKQETYTRVRILKDNINVRSGPGTDYDRLGSAYSGYDFEFVENVDEEWTKIIYDGKEAYIYSEYVELVEMYLNVDGKYVEIPVNAAEYSGN